MTHPFFEWVNPYLGGRLTQVNLDKRFVRGEGCRLIDHEGRTYLDFIASYGALPFGYNHPGIWSAVDAVHRSMEPSLTQPSALDASGELAQRLVACAPAGLRYVTFGNSGAEAIEAAIKLCRVRTHRPGILSAANSFHGKTLGALSATANAKYQRGFGAPAAGFHHVPFGDLDALSAEIANRPGYFAAFLIEAIQGEGGISVAPDGYLAAAQEICRKAGVLLIVDEIQTGLGRTGAMFASTAEGVAPDVMTLAKALGGGLIPIGACLCTDDVYTEDFALKHSSTFGGNALACRVGIAALDLLERDGHALVRQVAENGHRFKEGLLVLQRRYPSLITEVRGRGYMLGLRFDVSAKTWPWRVLGYAAEQGRLTPLIASYLLNVEAIRLAPTLNSSDVIRIEPPLIATADDCRQVLEALDRTMEVFASGDSGRVLASLLTAAPRPPTPVTTTLPPRTFVSPREDEERFAFIQHPFDSSTYNDFDPTLGALSELELSRLVDEFEPFLEPFVASEVRVVSPRGATAFGEFIVVGRTAEQFVTLPRDQMLAEIRQAVELARDRGARIVGLGAYTSSVTRGGLDLTDVGVALTTGNSYTVVAGLEAVRIALDAEGQTLAGTTAAIVGAAGSIGRATATLLAEDVSRLILIGNPVDDRRESRIELLRQVADGICRHLLRAHHAGRSFEPGSLGDQVVGLGGYLGDAPETAVSALARSLERAGSIVIVLGVDERLRQADVVITATSSPKLIVPAGTLKQRAIVCDLSRPPNVGPEVQAARPDVLLIDGGLTELPGRPFIGPFGLPLGLAYACMAETVMLALEKRYQHTSLGTELNLEEILSFRSIADRHGFRVAALQSYERAESSR